MFISIVTKLKRSIFSYTAFITVKSSSISHYENQYYGIKVIRVYEI